MKIKRKRLAVIFALTLILIIAGCGNEPATSYISDNSGMSSGLSGVDSQNASGTQNEQMSVQAGQVDNNPYDTLTAEQQQLQMQFEMQYNMIVNSYNQIVETQDTMTEEQFNYFYENYNQQYQQLMEWASDNQLVMPIEMGGLNMEWGNSFNLPTSGFGGAYGFETYNYGTDYNMNGGNFNNMDGTADPGLFNGMDNGMNNTMPDMNMTMPGMGW